MTRRIQRADRLYGMGLCLAALVFHWRVLFIRGFVFPWDFRVVHVPLATFIANSFRHGEMPLWDPYTYCGNPLFANIQAALFYPPVVAAELTGALLGLDLIPRLLAIAVVAQIIFAGVCTFALLRALKARPGAAWVGAMVYELGCFFAAQAEHMGAMHGASWLPLIWLCVVKLRNGVRWYWTAVLALALSLTILAGLPQVGVAAFASALTLAILMAACRLASWRALLGTSIACISGLLLAAVQFIPTAQLTENSVAKFRTEWLKTGGGIPPSALFSLVVPNYWTVFDPARFRGPTDLTFLYLYSSILGLALTLAVLIWKPAPWVRVCGALTGLAAIAMMGDKTPVGRAVLAALPLNIRIGIHPEFLLCVFSLGLALLAGLGADRFLPSSRAQTLAGLIIALDLILVGSGRPMNTMSLAAEPGFTRNSADGSTEFVQELRNLASATTPPARFDMSRDVSYNWSSMGPLLQIPTANGCDPLAPERVIQVRLSFAPGARWGSCYQVVNPSSPVVGLVNDRFLVSHAAISDPSLALAAEANGYRIYENKRWLPRFFLARRVIAVRNLDEAANSLHDPSFRPDETTIVETAEGAFPNITASGQVNVLSYSANQWTVRVDAASDALLVNGDTYYPGWEATIDGQSANIYIADVAFRAIKIPPGQHQVRMRFVPGILNWSAAISLLALAAAGLAIWRGLKSAAS